MKTPDVLSLNRIIVAKCSSIPTKIGNRIDWTKENLFADTFLCQNTVIPSKHWRYTIESILGTLRLSSKYIMHRITSVKITNVWIFPITYCMKSSNSKCSIQGLNTCSGMYVVFWLIFCQWPQNYVVFKY